MTQTSSAPPVSPQRVIAPIWPWGIWIALILSALTLAGQFVPELGWSAVAFWLLAPGLALVRLVRPTGLPQAGLVPALSVSVTVLASSISLWVGVWPPRPATVVAAALVLGYAVVSLTRLPRPAIAVPRGGWSWVAIAIGAAALVLWLMALPEIAGERRPFGLLVPVPAFTASLVLAVLAFLIALRLRSTGLMWVMLLLMGVIQRGVAPLTLHAPWADWSYKHLGVVELIASTGTLHRGLDIYQGWPGFFSAITWISQASGVSSFDLATWFTLVVTFATIGAVYTLARALGLAAAESLMVAMVALLANWIGQDYFSPQAIGFILAIVVAAAALRAKESRAAWVFAVICYGALVITHQLTPFWLLGALGLLAIFRRVPWLLVVTCSVFALAQLAANFEIADAYGLFTGFDPVSNAQTASAAAIPGAEMTLQRRSGFAASIGLWGLAAMIALAGLIKDGWRGWFRGTGPITGVLAFSPFVILLGQNYGGEAMLRVMLYSIPGCALLVGPWLTRQVDGRLWRRLLAFVITVFLALVPGHAYFATFYHYGVTTSEYQIEAQLERSVPGSAFLSPLSIYWPTRSSEAYAPRLAEYWDYDQSLQIIGGGLDSPDYLDVLDAHLEERPSPTYVIVGPRMDAFAAYGGIAPAGTVERLREELRQRDRWQLLIDRDGVTVHRYVPEPAKDQEAARWMP